MTGYSTVSTYSDGLLPNVTEGNHEILRSTSIGKRKLGIETGTEAQMDPDGYGKRGLSEVSTISMSIWYACVCAQCDSSKWLGTGEDQMEGSVHDNDDYPFILLSFFFSLSFHLMNDNRADRCHLLPHNTAPVKRYEKHKRNHVPTPCPHHQFSSIYEPRFSIFLSNNRL